MPSDLYPDRPGLARWETLARRFVTWPALAAAALMLLAMAVSYAGLRSFYLGAGLPAWMASAYPLCIDLMALVAYAAWLSIGGWYPVAVVAFGVLASAAAQGYHTSHGGIGAGVDNAFVLYLAGSSAIVCAALAAHLFVMIAKRALPADFIEAMRGTEQQWTSLSPSSSSSPASLPSATSSASSPAGVSGAAGNPPFVHRPPAEKPRPLRALPAEQPRKTVTAASTATGPCADGCQHHGPATSKSTRYRCEATLAGRTDECRTCAKTRQDRKAAQA